MNFITTPIRLLVTEFMHTPRPADPRRRLVFDYTLTTRLRALRSEDAVLIIANRPETIESLQPLLAPYSHLTIFSTISNPTPNPNRPHYYLQTDRWARILTALSYGKMLATRGSLGWLVMPAHDALYSPQLLSELIRLSESHGKKGYPAAVSPYPAHHHSPVPGAEIPQPIIDLVNHCFGRDLSFRWKIRLDRVQGFWGKMGMIPFGVCEEILKHADPLIWEDDQLIDSILRRSGYGVRALWVEDPRDYRQALPAFTRADVKAILYRHLHYSLNIPGLPLMGSHLTQPLGKMAQGWATLNPRFKRLTHEAESLIAECVTEITEALQKDGYSAVEWGAYRYIARVGWAEVEVCDSINEA
jgi:hypothetical protein